MDELTRSRSLSELEKTTEHRVAESAKSTAKHMQKQAALSAEKASKNKGTIWVSKFCLGFISVVTLDQ